MGCDTCKSECGREDGCGTRKATQKVVLDGLAARLYPSRTWGLADDEACFRAGLSLSEVQRLGRQVAAVNKAPVFFVPGGEQDLCSFLYVLCLEYYIQAGVSARITESTEISLEWLWSGYIRGIIEINGIWW